MRLTPLPVGAFGLEPVVVDAGQRVLVGRSSRCQVRLPVEARLISRLHATLFQRDGLWYVLDESRHGTYLAGQRVAHGEPVPLTDGDRLRFGDCEFVVQLPGAGHDSARAQSEPSYRVSVQTVDLAAAVDAARVLQSALELPERLGRASSEAAMYEAACEYLVATLAPAIAAAYVTVSDADGAFELLGRADRGALGHARHDLQPVVSRRIVQRLRDAPETVFFLQRQHPELTLDATVSSATRVVGASWLEADGLGRPTVLHVVGDQVLGEGEQLIAQYLRLVSTLVRQHLRTLRNAHLANYFSPKVLKLLMQNGGRGMIEGEPRLTLCTSLFFDVRGSSLAISSAMDLTGIYEDLRAIIGDVSEAVFETDGTIIDYAGDGVFAAWGIPFPQPEQAVLAVRCALAINQRLKRRSFRVLRGGGPLCGIGIAKGPVLVGGVGSSRVAKYGVFGPSVNTAQRLAGLRGQSSAEGPIHMTSQVMAELLGSGITARSIGPQRLSGFETDIEVFQTGTHGFGTGTFSGPPPPLEPTTSPPEGNRE
jgi:class 3 adenylate cyclase